MDARDAGYAEKIEGAAKRVTLDAVRAWAAALPPSEIVGLRRTGWSCPVHTFLKHEVLGEDILFYVSQGGLLAGRKDHIGRVYNHRDMYTYPNDIEIKVLIDMLDNGFQLRVSAGEVVQAIDAIRADIAREQEEEYPRSVDSIFEHEGP